MDSSRPNDEVLSGLSEKLNGLKLTGEEQHVLGTILSRAASADNPEVEGFGWDEGVAALKEKVPGQSISVGGFGGGADGLKMTPSKLGFSLGNPWTGGN